MINASPAPLPPKKIINKISRRRFLGSLRGFFAFAAAVALIIFAGWAFSDGRIFFENYLYAQIYYPVEEIKILAEEKPLPAPELELDAKAALCFRSDDSSEKIIFERNIAEKLPIASLTKLMTAVVILENPVFYKMDLPAVISFDAARQPDVPVFGNLLVGQTYTVAQLLNLMLYYSSNDAAYALAEIIGKEEFVAAMNFKAEEIGLKNSQFYNSSGLDIDNGPANSASVDDLLVLTKYIIKRHPEILSFSIKPGPYLTENGIFNLKFWDGHKLIGGKTGFTERAGGCMMVVFENQDRQRYINVVLGSSSPETRVVQMQKLINYANNSDK